jgi:hypothetical protein
MLVSLGSRPSADIGEITDAVPSAVSGNVRLVPKAGVRSVEARGVEDPPLDH